MIRISDISFFCFSWKNEKLDWPKCARTNIACPQLNTLISLYAVLLMFERVWTLLPRFLADSKVTHVQDNSYVIATKNKVLKNNTMSGKSLRILNMMNGKGGSKRRLYLPRAMKSLFH